MRRTTTRLCTTFLLSERNATMSSDKPDQVSQFNLKELRGRSQHQVVQSDPKKETFPCGPNEERVRLWTTPRSLLSDIRNTVDAEIADEAEKYRKRRQNKEIETLNGTRSRASEHEKYKLAWKLKRAGNRQQLMNENIGRIKRR